MRNTSRKDKNEIVLKLVPQVFAWARSVHPSQPLTSGVLHGDWSSLDAMPPLARVQIEESDVISFHDYGWPEDFESAREDVEQFHRPLICTEYMARGIGQHLRHDSAYRAAVSCRRHQLGSCGGEEPDVSSMGFMAAALCDRTADYLVSRCFSRGWDAIPRARAGDYSRSDQR